jgi:hypothetical protein
MTSKWIQKLGNKAVHSFIDHAAVSTFTDALRIVRTCNLLEQHQIAGHVIRTTKIASGASKEKFDCLLNQFQEAADEAERTFGKQSTQYLMTKLAVSAHVAIFATKPDAKAGVVEALKRWLSELNANRVESQK